MRKLCAELPALFLFSTAIILMEKEAVCANNCASVDPNPVVEGGTATVLAAASASLQRRPGTCWDLLWGQDQF
jgi:hypothetical protein